MLGDTLCKNTDSWSSYPKEEADWTVRGKMSRKKLYFPCGCQTSEKDSPRNLRWKREKGWNLYQSEEELVSSKQISHSSNILSDSLARETGMSQRWVGPLLDQICLVMHPLVFYLNLDFQSEPQRWIRVWVRGRCFPELSICSLPPMSSH